MVKKAYLERATTKELLEEIRQRATKSFLKNRRPLWNRNMYDRVVDLLGILPKEILDYKPEED